MMNKLLIKGRTALAVIAGIMVCGIIAQSIGDKLPINLVLANQGNLLSTNEQEITEEVNTAIVVAEEAPVQVAEDTRVIKIREYLSGRNAPLSEYAEEFVKAADAYGIDYRLVASISIIESGGGKSTFRPYNAWGWGKMTFTSWTEGIWTVSKGLSKYYSNGLTTPALIGPSYCPPNATKWGNNVQSVMNIIETM